MGREVHSEVHPTVRCRVGELAPLARRLQQVLDLPGVPATREEVVDARAFRPGFRRDPP